MPSSSSSSGDIWVGVRLGLAREQQLETVVARVGELVEADHALGVEGGAPRYAADQPVAAGELDEQLAGALGHRGVLGALDDRRERPVHVGEDRGPLRVRAKGCDQLDQLVCLSNWSGLHSL